MDEKNILPPTYFIVSLFLSAALHLFFPVIKFIYFPWDLLGLIFLAAGGLLNLFADMKFKKAKTTVKPFEYSTALVTKGVFNISRNPMYLGMGLTLIGESILLGSLTPFIVAVIFFVLMDILFIRREEEMLSEKFGETFKSYKRKVRRWV